MSNESISKDKAAEDLTAPRIWKISHGHDEFGSNRKKREIRDLLRDKQRVCVHGETGKNQGDNFLHTISVGDYFYLCYGGYSIELFGRFKNDQDKGEVFASELMEDGWYERPYEIIFPTRDDKPKMRYCEFTGIKRGLDWEPNGFKTCVVIPQDQLGVFQERILQPYFGITLSQISEIDHTEQKMTSEDENNAAGVAEQNKYKQDPYSSWLISAKNIILRGAPGTGKTYLAKQIAADIVSNGTCADYDDLSPEERKQIEFVQFHPSYDYTDFVEGLRPTKNDGKSIGFELRPGALKEFVDDVLAENKKLIKQAIIDHLKGIIGEQVDKKTNDKSFTIVNVVDNNADDKYAHDQPYVLTDCPLYQDGPPIYVKIDDLYRMLLSNKPIKNVGDTHEYITIHTPKPNSDHSARYDTYYWGIYSVIKDYIDTIINELSYKKYVFIIDEINRGEISKIFGELFFSIDPGYRGPSGAVTTQYANLHENLNEKFYIPENVYIIGTMNDIDRSVDSFDFAMRRRFRFIEISAEASQIMLESLGDKKDDAISRMNRLNEAISKTEGLNENYHIGAAYFLKLNKTGVNVESLWTDFLRPLLQEYVRGMSEEKTKLQAFEDAYNLVGTGTGSNNASGTSGETDNPKEQPTPQVETQEKP